VSGLLGAAQIRALADRLDLRPTKRLGQNFVVDGNTVRRIITHADLAPSDQVLEVGPGLGSLTLGLLAADARVTAVEIDPVLAGALPDTVAEVAPARSEQLRVIAGDALQLTASELSPPPTSLVANLPYNVSVPVLLHLLAEFPSIERGLVMVQREVGERLAAGPGSRTYGIPSVKLAWFAEASVVGAVPRSVFWPVPNVDSVLVALRRREPPASGCSRSEVFAVVDAAFAQRRKMLRSALAGWAGSVSAAESVLTAAGVASTSRGEVLTLPAFAAICDAARSSGLTTHPGQR
jgi:16S rRNA (adenine1518-N6/adenine1519-N6)-dimethyltransferase